MHGPSTLQIAALVAAASGAIWMASIAFSRTHVPGGRYYGGLSLAVALWALMSAAHSLPQPVSTQLMWTKLEYVGLQAVPPLWLLFCASYVRAPWASNPRVRTALWILPAAGLLGVITNDWHHLHFTSVDRPAGVTVYHWGPLFWANAAHNYTLMGVGSILLLRGLRQFGPAYRSQTFMLVGAAIVPWLGNAFYISGLADPGFDPTPVLFAVSLALFFWGLYTRQLFDVVPLARAAVFERLGDAVFVLDGAFRVVDANAAAMALTSASQPASVIGRHPEEFLAWWRTMPKPPAPEDEDPHVARAGDKVLEVQSAKLALPGNHQGTLLWIRDISNRHRLEQRLREQERIESLTVMAAGLAHDFNNLLTAILGNADYLSSKTPEDSEEHASAAAIATAAQQAADLVSQIVAFSGQGRAIVVPVSIEDAVGDTIQALARTLRTRALITHESDPDLPRVTADAVQVRQAVLALLTNAVDAVASTHGSVDVFTGREGLDAAAFQRMSYSAAAGPGEYVFVEVKDDGPGIPPQVMTRIFEPFFSTRDFSRGLGLAAVHGIVRGHKGAIRIWSAPGEGTRVRIWWPLGSL